MAWRKDALGLTTAAVALLFAPTAAAVPYDDGPPPALTVQITSGPAWRTSQLNTTFEFSANRDATFSCRVYRTGQVPSAFEPCGPGSFTTYVRDGDWTFDVLAQATDGSGEAATATRSFRQSAAACGNAERDVDFATIMVHDNIGYFHAAKAKLRAVKASGEWRKIRRAKEALRDAIKALVRAGNYAVTAQSELAESCVDG